jgi:hypothetical protein
LKVAIRDDDLNFFFNHEQIEKDYREIWDICPISMSVVPFIKGDWPLNFQIANNRGPGVYTQEELKLIINDNTKYPIGENKALVEFVIEQIKLKHIHLTIHGIHHRNEDPTIPKLQNNYGIGAEFYTIRDMREPLENAKKYVENLFGQPIKVFTPPQNLISRSGLKAVVRNNLSICTDYPRLSDKSTIKIIGVESYIKYALFKILNLNNEYPYVLRSSTGLKIVGHHRLQPGTDINSLYSSISKCAKFKGSFVISTHSFGFNYLVKNTNKTMGTVLRELIQHINDEYPEAKFVNLSQMFDD